MTNFDEEITAPNAALHEQRLNNASFYLTYFSPINDELVGEFELESVTCRDVAKWFYLPSEEEALAGCHIVMASQRIHLVNLVQTEIDLNNYDYFVEAMEG